MSVLFTAQGAVALELAAGVDDPASLAAATMLRQHVSAEIAAEALTQETLRRKAVGKFGNLARELFFTRDGLEQASRSRVAQWRAARYLELGWSHVVDLGCGIGADARAFLDAGIAVTAIERDPVTAQFARANLPGADVITSDATSVPISETSAVFLDPARRSAKGRTWDHRQLTPSWEFTLATLAAHQGCAKLGPGLDRSLLPSTALAEWVSDGGDVVECGLWSGYGTGLAATHLPSGERLVYDGTLAPAVTDVRGFIHEPDGAAIRAKLVPQLAAEIGASALDPHVAYLTSDAPADSAWLTSFAMVEVLPYKEKALRQWVAANGIGTLEIKKRGIDVDPALLRKQLKPKGKNQATLILSPTPSGAQAYVCQRVSKV